MNSLCFGILLNVVVSSGQPAAIPYPNVLYVTPHKIILKLYAGPGGWTTIELAPEEREKMLLKFEAAADRCRSLEQHDG